MKKLRNPILRNLAWIVLFLFIFAAPAYAQDFKVPDTAVEAVRMLIEFAGVVFGLGSVTNVMADAFKKLTWLPFLTPDKKGKIGGLVAEVAVIVIAALIGWLGQMYLYPFAQHLDQVGLWPVIGSTIAFARMMYWQRKKAVFFENGN